MERERYKPDVGFRTHGHLALHGGLFASYEDSRWQDHQHLFRRWTRLSPRICRLCSLTRTGAHEWGQFNIHVNVIAPAAVTASMMKSVDPKNAEMILERFPLKRFGDPEKDIAPLVVFLCGPASGYMTGNTVSVDGGVAMVV